MTRALLVGLLIACAALPAAATAQTFPRYVGYLGDGSGRAYHNAGQGGLHYLVLTDSNPSSNGRYRVCLRGGAAGIRRCFNRRLRFGFGRVNVSR